MVKKITILALCNRLSSSSGGVQRVISTLTESENCNFVCRALAPSTKLAIQNLMILLFKRKIYAGIDVIHSHTPVTLAIAMLTKPKKVPVVHTVHNTQFKFINTMLMRIFLRYADKLVAVTHEVNNHLRENFSKMGVVIHNCVQTDEYHGQKSYKHVVMVGRLHQQKNPELALKYFISQKDLYLDVIGNGILYSKLKKMIGQNENIKLHGYFDPSNFYKKAGFYITTTNYEGFGLTIVEAMRSGCIIIAPNLPVIQEVTGGNFIEIGYDVQSIESAISNLKKLSYEELQIISKNNIKYSKQYNKHKFLCQHESLYRALVTLK